MLEGEIRVGDKLVWGPGDMAEVTVIDGANIWLQNNCDKQYGEFRIDESVLRSVCRRT